MDPYIPSRRNLDSKEETHLAKYLDLNIYPALAAKYNVTFTRNNKRETQLKGVDIIVRDKNEQEILIDEKAQLHYLNNPIPTCAFEISSYQKGQFVDGWLFRNDYLTQRYFYITHIFLNSGKNAVISPSDFKSCRIISVDRSALINALKERGITKDTCEQLANKNINETKILFSGVEGVYLKKSPSLNENPLNLVIKQNTLLDFDKTNIKIMYPF